MDAESSSYLHLFWGYAAIWLCIAFFVWNAVREQRQLRKELIHLQTELTELREKIAIRK